MLAARYRFAFFDGLNRYYVREEDADRLRHFDRPVNVIDDVKTPLERRLERVVADFGRQLAEAETRNQELTRRIDELSAKIVEFNVERELIMRHPELKTIGFRSASLGLAIGRTVQGAVIGARRLLCRRDAD